MNLMFWLALSVLLVALSLVAILLALLPALRELGRAAQGAEKLFDTLNRELPPTLEAIRLTSLEITELTDDLTDSIQSVGQVAQQVDSTVTTARTQAHQVTQTSKHVAAGLKAAWQTLVRDESVRDESALDASGQDPSNAVMSNDPTIELTLESSTSKIKEV
jgi:uncharacterized protein YoxC